MEELGEKWIPADPAAWTTAKGAYGRLVEPMARAVGAADSRVYDQAATALQVVRVPGSVDGLKGEQLYKYMYKPPRERKAGSKKKDAAGVIRWAGRALVDEAEMILRHGVELRAAMQGKRDTMPSHADEFQELQATLKRVEGKLEVETAKKETAQGNARQNTPSGCRPR